MKVSDAQMGVALRAVSDISDSDIIAECGKGANRKNRTVAVAFFLIALGCFFGGMFLAVAASSDRDHGALSNVGLILLFAGFICFIVSIGNLTVYKGTFIKVTANRIYGKTGNTFINCPISMVTSVTTNAKNSITVFANNKAYKFKKIANCVQICNVINSLISSR